MEFTWDTSIDDIQNEVLQRLDQTPLPDEVKPRFLKFDPSQFPIIQLSIRGEKNEASLRDLAEKLTVELSKVDGVASVTTSGTITEEIRVLIDQDQLKTYGLTQSDIVNVIQANQISLPGNTVLSQDKELTTRIVSLLHTVEDVENLIVTKNPVTGETIRLNDVANVELVSKEQETITRTNQQPSVLVNVLQQSDANTAEVSKQFQKKLDELLQEERFQSIKADLLFDQGEYIEQSIGNIGNAYFRWRFCDDCFVLLFTKCEKSNYYRSRHSVFSGCHVCSYVFRQIFVKHHDAWWTRLRNRYAR
jgi:hydrophobic/amphiphilic exporter-1 (mainly G- bacteria), HAE1 family